ncbi:MAG: SDR family NAD(P)-dependent oxidoreductase [bacterium]|nr:SDR family NAD(P)-dependent oxidoreductase [bacterium]
MAKLNFKDKWVLVTGASSGLGKEMALYLAKTEQANVVITARRKERLEELKKEIEDAGSTSVKIIPADLSKPEDVEKLFDQTVVMVDLYAVINNAGITYYGNADTSQLKMFGKIINVNFNALMTLTLKFLEWFKKKGDGAILNVTSETAFVPIPYQAVYSASKHAAQAFTESLYMENKNSNIVISSYAPGGIATEMLSISGLDQKHSADSPFNMDAAKAAKLGIKTFKKKKFYSVPGFSNKLTVFIIRFFSRKLVARVTEMLYRPPVKEKK